MKTPVLLAAAICALPLAVFAQNPPPAGAPPAPGAPGAPATGAKPEAKPVPLNASEKKFLKDSTEGLFFVLELTGPPTGFPIPLLLLFLQAQLG